MPKRWVLLTCMLFLGPAGTSEATPVDSPDIVYIDGRACNSACQSYMAWSRKIMPMPGQPTQRSAKAVAHRVTRIRGEGSKPPAHARMAKQAVPNSSKMPREKIADLKPADNAAAAPDTTRANIAGSPPNGDSAAGSNARTIQEQVTAATALAEQVTAATAPDRKGRSEAVTRGDTDKTATMSPNNTDNLVALLLARPEIKSVSDLTSKSIAIDDRQFASSGSVRTAIVAAGAAEVQLSGGETKPLNRLLRGEVPAAVLTLVSAEAAEWFPEIAGFKIFRVPLGPRSLQARLEPAGDAAAKSDAPPAKIADSPDKAGAAANSGTRTIQEQVAAATALAEQATAASASEQKSYNTDGASPANTDHLVALLMARPEIKSVSDLIGKDVAIDDRQAASNGIVRTAVAAAGATEVQLSEGQTKAIDRLIGGEVPAAVLTLVSAEAAEWFPEIAGFKIFRIPLSPRSLQARLEPAASAAARSDASPAKIADLPAKAGATNNSSTRTIQEEVAAAMALAEHVTASRTVPAPEQKSNNADASSNNTDHLVALLVARPEIKSVSDLTGKNVAIDDRQSASSGSIRTAIAAARAAEVQLSQGQATAINRLIGREVPAAVLTLVSPEAAEWFPEIAGFKVFRIPLSPRSLKARL